ncbi:MAG TPA: ATP-binding protein [Anaerolineaceae bacterium]|nr:ATP-binding protein [Anaerolineaceae bacterium]
MREIALHLLDIAENSVAAKATRVTIQILEDSVKDILYLSVEDNGCGMSAETVAKVIDPFVTSRTTRKVGLGIPLLKAAAEACNGWFKISSSLGVGTLLETQFQRSHIDRMPLGNLADTLLTLLIGSPEIQWLFHYRVNAANFTFDSQPIMEELEGVLLTEPIVLAYLREVLGEITTISNQ